MRTAPRCLRFALILAMLIVGGCTLAQRLTVTVPTTGEIRTVIPLDEEFGNRELEVSLAGWNDGGPVLKKGLPEGLTVSFPPTLSSSRTPILPLMIRLEGAPLPLDSLTLVLEISTDGSTRSLSVAVELPRQAVFELEAPDSVSVFPDRPTVLPLLVRNVGNTEGRAIFSFEGLDVDAPHWLIPAGAERTVQVRIPPLPSGDAVLTVSLTGGMRELRRRVRLSGIFSAQRSPYGVLATLRGESSGLFQQGLVPLGTRESLALKGYLSRTTYLDATLVGEGTAVSDASFWVRHRGTSLQWDDASRDNAAGEVGTGFYLTHAFEGTTLLEELELALAVPTGEDVGNPRFGIRFDASHFDSTLSLDLAGQDLRVQLRTNEAPFYASFQLSPALETVWQGRAGFSSQPFSLRFEGRHTTGSTLLALEPRYRVQRTPIGPLTVQVRSELNDWQFAGLSFSGSGDRGRLALKALPRSGVLEGEYRLRPDPLELKLTGATPLWGDGQGRLGLDVTFPVGPLNIATSTTLTSAGNLESDTRASYVAPLPNGLLSSTMAFELSDILGQGRADYGFDLDYAGYSGFQGEVAASIPIHGEGALEVQLGLSYSSFLSSPPGLVRALDGADPSARTLTLLLDDGKTTRPLSGIRLLGCGSPALTDSRGRAVLSGPVGSCTIRVDVDTLPPDAYRGTEEIVLEPGAAERVTLPAVTDLIGSVRYRDPESGEILGMGQVRELRVLVEGPVSRWADVTLPLGEFVMSEMPVGEYQATARGFDVVQSFELTTRSNELLITIPASPQTVLDPARLTPPVRVDLTSLLPPPGEPVRLGITAEAPIERVVVRLAGSETFVDAAVNAGERVDIEVPVPAGVSGAIPVEVEIEFESGQVARRTLQVVIVDNDQGGAAPATTDEPGSSQSGSSDTRVGEGDDASRESAGAYRDWETEHVGDIRDLEPLPVSDSLLQFYTPASSVPPGVTIAVYVRSEREISSVSVKDIEQLQSRRRVTEQGDQIWFVLAVTPVISAGILEVTAQVEFIDGSVEERTLSFVIDPFAPVPFIPGRELIPERDDPFQRDER